MTGWKDNFIQSATNRHTCRARQTDLQAFEETIRMSAVDFLQLTKADAVDLLATYQHWMNQKKLAPATINRRLATVRAWVRFGRIIGATALEPDELIGEQAIQPTPVEWLDRSTCRALCESPDTTTRQGLRDSALLQLLCEVPLLGWQIGEVQVADFDYSGRVMQVRVSSNSVIDTIPAEYHSHIPRERLTYPASLSTPTAHAIHNYLAQLHCTEEKGAPLFCNLDRRPRHAGSALVPKSVLYMVQEYGRQMQIPRLSTRTLRISAIMNALDEANGNIAEAAQRFCHLSLVTWERYNCRRTESRQRNK